MLSESTTFQAKSPAMSASAQHTGGMLPNTPSPVAAARSGPATGLSFVSLPAAARSSPTAGEPFPLAALSTSASPAMTAMANITSGTLLASPQVLSRDGTWPAGAAVSGTPTSDPSLNDAHLSGTEPRYFPGVAMRSQRRNSVRAGSYHEMDDSSAGGVGRARKNTDRSLDTFEAADE